MSVAHDYVFNFSASPIGGGFKRLYEYARWFDANGGARFLIHPRCGALATEFPSNEFTIVDHSPMRRMLGDVRAVRRLRNRVGTPACYYSYGIPIFEPVATVNWFHVSNVLPFSWRSVPMPFRDQLKFGILGYRLKQHLDHADVISAESQASLNLIAGEYRDRLFLSVNGSDDELQHLEIGLVAAKDRIASVVGTYRHKALGDSCRVFDMLRSADDQLTLRIFGDDRWIVRAVRSHPGVIVMGNRPRSEVIATLRRSKYYISTTLIENSSNAASEGVFFADQSYISDIGPHRELLAGMPYDHVAVPGLARPVLHVTRDDISPLNLRTWDQVINDMIERIDTLLLKRPTDRARHV